MVYLSILYFTIIAYYPEKSVRLMNKKITENFVNPLFLSMRRRQADACSEFLVLLPVVNFVTRCTVT